MDEAEVIREPQRKCVICRALVDEEDLFCANCGAEVPHVSVEVEGELQSRESTRNFTCNGCGASMSYDASAQALRCPFCGSEQLERKPDSKTIAPRRVVPFQIDRSKADEITRNWLGTGWLRPADLSDEAVITKMTPVYVPYWVFTARTSTYWTADTSNTPAGARGDWFPLAGEHSSSYGGIIVGASGALTPNETHTLCPFHLNAGVPPSQVDLDNAIVEEFNVPRKYARPHARQTVEAMERRAVDERYVPGRSRNVKVNTLLSGLSSEPMLLPIWIMAYQYKEKTYRFLVNGQTGEPHGTKPISYRKIVMIAAIVIAVIVGILICAGVISGAASMSSQAEARTVALSSDLSGDSPTLVYSQLTIDACSDQESLDVPRTDTPHQLRERRRRSRSAPAADERDDRPARRWRAVGDCRRCGAQAGRRAGAFAARRSAGIGQDDVRLVHSA